MRYLRFIFGICVVSLIITTTTFGHSPEYRAGRAADHIDYCGKYDLNQALYNKYGKSEDYESGKSDHDIQSSIGGYHKHYRGGDHEINYLDCGELEEFVKALLNPSAPASNITKQLAMVAKQSHNEKEIENIEVLNKKRTSFFAEDVNADGFHWRLVLTKIGNQVKLELSLFLEFETKIFYCPLIDLGIKNQFFIQCEAAGLAPRVLKGNLKKASLWSNGSAGGAEFEFISSNQIANYQSFVEKTGLSSTSHFIKANLKPPMLETNMAEEKERRGQVLAEVRRKAEEKEDRLKIAQTKRKAKQEKIQNPDAIAVIIGNRDYKGDTPDVEFAINDADAMREFVLNKLGYRPGNVIDLRDATQAELLAAFGSDKSHKGTLFDYVRSDESDVIVFYSGHGVPGLSDRRGYLLSVDANPNKAELTGYPVDTLLKNLAKIPAKSMTVFIDACFSGNTPKGMLVDSMSGLTVEIRQPKKASKGMVVLTASRGDQVASWDKNAKHGLFTKHLLEALNGAADKQSKTGNKDGKVTLGEVKAYLDREMTYQARRRFSRDQHATVSGDLKTVLSAY